MAAHYSNRLDFRAAPIYTPPPANPQLDPAHPLFSRIMAFVIVTGDGSIVEVVTGNPVTAVGGTMKFVDRGLGQWALDMDGTYGIRVDMPTWPVTPPGKYDNWFMVNGAEVREMSGANCGVMEINGISPTAGLPFVLERDVDYTNVFSVWIPAPSSRFNLTGSEDITVDLIGQGYHVFGINKGGGGSGAPNYANLLYVYDDSVRTPRSLANTYTFTTGGYVTFGLNYQELPRPGNKSYWYWGLFITGLLSQAESDSICYDPWQLLLPDEGGGGFDGGLAATEQRDTAAFSGTMSDVGDLAATEARDTGAFSGTMIPSFSSGSLAATESRDAFAALGDSEDPGAADGGLAATEQRDTAAFSGTMTDVGDLAATEQRDVGAFSGTMIPSFSSGTLAANESRDTFAALGDAFQPGQIGGSLHAVEQRDTMAAQGLKTFYANLAATEVRDQAAFSGFWNKIITGTLAATEQADSALFDGRDLEEDMANTIALRDSNTGIGASPEQPWRDGAPRNPDGTLISHIIGDTGSPDNFMNNAGVIRQARLVQAISDTPAGGQPLPGWVCQVALKTGEWGWCYSTTEVVTDPDSPIGMSSVIGT